MKKILMKKLGPYVGVSAFVAICAGFVLAPSSCSLTPDQQAKLHSISVPVAGIISKVAIDQGWVESGDEISIQRGIAVVTSGDDHETKLFKLAEIGLDHALNRGLVSDGDTIKVNTPTQITITSPPESLPAPDPAVTTPLADSIAPDPAK
jgi:hypothetical protein